MNARMPEPDDQLATSEPPVPVERQGLALHARVLAVIIGLALAGAGVFAVVTTESEWGAVALLLVAGVLTLIGIQGTPLIRVGNDKAIVELQEFRQRQRARDHVGEILATVDDPNVIEAVVDTADAISPGSIREFRKLVDAERKSRTRSYIRQVVNALESFGYDTRPAVYKQNEGEMYYVRLPASAADGDDPTERFTYMTIIPSSTYPTELYAKEAEDFSKEHRSPLVRVSDHFEERYLWRGYYEPAKVKNATWRTSEQNESLSRIIEDIAARVDANNPARLAEHPRSPHQSGVGSSPT